jgi:hypothetical protein
MSQDPLSTPSGSGLAVRTGINDAIARLASKASGTTRPTDIAVYETWLETDNPGGGVASLWLWDGTSDIPLGLIDTAAHTFTPLGPTQSTSDDSSKMATTAHVKDMLATVASAFVDVDNTGYALASAYSNPFEITEGIQLFDHEFTAPNGNTVFIEVDAASCVGQNTSQILGVFIDGATNAVSVCIAQFSNVATHGGPNRVVYSYTSDGDPHDIEIRAAGGGNMGRVTMKISSFV